MNTPSNKSGPGKGAVAVVFGAGTLMVLCCALGPAVIAVGVLGTLAALGRNPFVIAAAAIAIAATAVLLIRRQRANSSNPECCPPQAPASATQTDPTTKPSKQP